MNLTLLSKNTRDPSRICKKKIEQEQLQRDKAREGLIQAERRSHAVANELEEAKTQLEHADRQRRCAE